MPDNPETAAAEKPRRPKKKLLWQNLESNYALAVKLRTHAKRDTQPSRELLLDAAARIDAQDAQVRSLIDFLADRMSFDKLLDLLLNSGFNRNDLTSLYLFPEQDVIKAEARRDRRSDGLKPQRVDLEHINAHVKYRPGAKNNMRGDDDIDFDSEI